MPGDDPSQVSRCEEPISSPPRDGRDRPKKRPVGDRQPHPIFLVPVLEDEKLMAQGEDFCLQSSSRTERITKRGEEESRNREHHPQSLFHIALSAIRSARASFW